MMLAALSALSAQCMFHSHHPLHASLQVEKPSDILTAERLVFPGVGTYGQAMRILSKQGMIQPLKEYLQVWAKMWALQARVWTLSSVGQQGLMMHQLRSTREESVHRAPLHCSLLTLKALKTAHNLQEGKPFLGICLGLQLLFEGSEESGGCEGLGIIPGSVAKFDTSLGLPVPHIGEEKDRL